MKKINYVLGLLNITIPQRSNVHRDSLGNPINVINIKNTPVKVITAFPNQTNSWDVITPNSFTQWKNDIGVSGTYSRFHVSPKSDVIVNRGKLVLQNEMRNY